MTSEKPKQIKSFNNAIVKRNGITYIPARFAKGYTKRNQFKKA